MRTKTIRLFTLAVIVSVASAGATRRARAQAGQAAYPVAAPLAQYVMSNRDSEIALARSAAPGSVANGAEVLVLGRDGYATAVKGGNGFVCLVSRSWAAATNDPDFWNPKVRAPMCVNAPAARTYLPAVLLKTRLVLAGKSKAEIAQAVTSAYDKKQLPALESGGMCYMMSKHQYLSDAGKSWHPHLMWFVAGDATKDWGANLSGSPIIAADDPEDRMTIFLVWVGHWSDGTPAPQGAP